MRRTVGVAAMIVMAAGFGAALPASSTVAPPNLNAVKSKLVTEALLLGVARAGTRLVAVGEYGNIVLSDDDGAKWRQANMVPTTVTLTAVHFADDKTGWAVGHDTVIIKTTDGGENWTKQYGGGESDNALLSVYFKDGSHGWAVGAFNYTVETTDAGQTWTERKTLMPPKAPVVGAAPAAPAADIDPTAKKEVDPTADPFAAEGGDENHLNAMFQGPDPDTLFVTAEAGAVYRSLDAGKTWEKILTGYVGSFWGGLTAKDGTVYAAGMRGNIWHSTDKGKTWAKLDTSGADQSIAMGIQLPDGSLVFVGLGGQVLYSPDGRKFTLTYRPDRKGLNAVALDGQDLLVFGEDGVKRQSITPKQEEIDVPLPQEPAAAP
jgi:photosystem II stability/assembly factor-like uncharacterized protein